MNVFEWAAWLFAEAGSNENLVGFLKGFFVGETTVCGGEGGFERGIEGVREREGGGRGDGGEDSSLLLVKSTLCCSFASREGRVGGEGGENESAGFPECSSSSTSFPSRYLRKGFNRD
mmetsp:Transcript_24502/g.51131  ORF Transcript_24502/g.51131 Transcript_24502/m.51131 type:complete len:118 (+) Transcript_24502:46-399(+)